MTSEIFIFPNVPIVRERHYAVATYKIALTETDHARLAAFAKQLSISHEDAVGRLVRMALQDLPKPGGDAA